MHEEFDAARAALARLDGAAGVVVRDSEGELLFEHRAADAFPAASVIKVPLVMTLYADASDGRLSLDEPRPVGERVDGSGVLRDLRDVTSLTLRDLATLAIVVSDNTATNRLIERIGADRVNARLDEWACPSTRLRRRMYDVAAARQGLENVMTPRDAVALLVRLLEGGCAGRASSDAVLAVLVRCGDGTLLRRYLPEDVRVANKSGNIDGSRNDVAVIWGPRRTIVVAVFASGVRDPLAACAFLGTVGWCAARAAGIATAALPFEAGAGA